MRKECLVFGGLVPDVYYDISRWPDRGQDAFIYDEKVVAGGCALNMAVTAENLGVRAHVVSCLGQDSVAAVMEEYLQGRSLSARFVRRTEGASGKCLVFSEPDGERTFLTRKGAEGVFTEELAASLKSEIYAVAGVTGYYLLNSDAHRIMDTLEYMHGRGTKILFDPSPLAGSVEPGLLNRILAVSSVVTPNVTELAVLEEITGKKLIASDGSSEPGPPVIIVKNGSAGGTVYLPGEKFPFNAERCDAVDTTGAGDSFSGALLYSMVNDIPIRDAVRLAARCAAKTVTIPGPHGFWSPEDVAPECF